MSKYHGYVDILFCRVTLMTYRPSARICHPSGQTSFLLKKVPILILLARDMSRIPFVMCENASPYFDCKSRFCNHPHTVLTRYRPRPKIRKEHNLLSANNGTVEEEEDAVREPFSPARSSIYLRISKTPGVIMPYWHPVSHLLHLLRAFLISTPEPYSCPNI
jgi:hypothetical protein